MSASSDGLLAALREKTRHKSTAVILDALIEGVWYFQPTDNAIHGIFTFNHPSMREDVTAPEWAATSPAWGSPTYRPLRQVSMLLAYTPAGVLKATSVFTRCAPPWVASPSSKRTYKAALEFVQEDWAPITGAV